MINDENKHELIDRYLEGILDKETLMGFEQQLSKNPQLRAEVELHRQIISAFKDEAEEEELRSVFKNAHQELEEKETHTRFIIPYWAVAAGIAIVLIAGLYFFQFRTTQTINNFAYITVLKDRGAVTGPAILDSIPVMLIPALNANTLQYQFADTLKLYGKVEFDNLSIDFDSAQQLYILTIEDKQYVLRPTQNVETLEPL